MRAEGITYKTIAEQMGMSLGSVKMFVSRYKRVNDRRCEQCGKLLPKEAAASQRFCSTKCKMIGAMRIRARQKARNRKPSYAEPAVQPSCPIRHPSIAPEHVIMLHCENNEHRNHSGVMPLFSLPSDDKQTAIR